MFWNPTNMRTVTFSLLLFVVVDSALGCNSTECSGSCRCMVDENPGDLAPIKTPQFVMLSFDDAVTVANFLPTFKELFMGAYKNPSGCNIGSTYFVSHEYNNYVMLHDLWAAGNEIAVHTITHETATEMWKKAPYDRLMKEIVGMRNFISTFAQIPVTDIQGFRAPFLQTAGNTTFQVLHNAKFTYDSSLPTRSHAGLSENDQPIWPYTLDHPFNMDCVVLPCPQGSYPGLWIVPMISFFKMREVIPNYPPEPMPCSMADACIPYPTTEEETFDYFVENFNRHYLKNRAPLPVFLHESWLKDPERKKGYVKFLEFLVSKDDVYVVTIQEVLDFIRNPKPLGEYKEKRCVTETPTKSCPNRNCALQFGQMGERYLPTCSKTCPPSYPWLENWDLKLD